MVMLSFEGLHVSLGRRRVLHGVDAHFSGGGLIGIIGPNGAGKSTLARTSLALLKPSMGRVLLDGVNVATIARADLAKRIAYLPQGQQPHWPLTAERLVLLGRLPHLAPFSAVSAADHDAVRRAMQQADADAFADRVVNELSGGERARVLLARALAVEAPVLIVDEPLAALDPGHQLQVMNVLKRQAETGALVIAILHDLGLAARYCDRLVLLADGRVAGDGQPDEVLTEALLEKVYGVRIWSGEVDGQRLIVPIAPSR